MRKKVRGFSLMEMMVATAIIAIVGSMSVPLLSRIQRAQLLRSAVRGISSDMLNARGIASSGKQFDAWAANERTAQAGIAIQDSTSYTVFADKNSRADGDELVVRTIVLPVGVQIESPAAGQEIRYRHNGTIPAPVNITVVDTHNNKRRTLYITGGGSVRID